ncbi:hypothetical protein D5086_000626 [Populus alba]|uniref:Uncharacterized protein n=1 Tax=Populus alba TaxID=43335 RepID=A0ACC4CYH4_POPAL
MEEMQLLIDVTEELQTKADASMQNILWNKRSIYKVPASVTALNRAAYRPQTVSFGPYHSYDDQLKPMEEHKHRALYFFLRRSGKSLELFLLSLNEVVQDLKDSYDQLDKSWNDDTGKFLQLMVLDGCFMLEIMRLAIQPSNDYAADDPVFSIHGRVYVAPFIRRDMLIVENQLPMLVLYKLVATESDGEKNEEFVNKLVLTFCHPNASVSTWGKCLHVLGFIQEEPPSGRRQQEKASTQRNEVTSYVFFMDNIIDNERDVALLHSRGIIQNAIGSDKAVAKLFNSLSKDIALDPDSSLELVNRQTVYSLIEFYEEGSPSPSPMVSSPPPIPPPTFPLSSSLGSTSSPVAAGIPETCIPVSHSRKGFAALPVIFILVIRIFSKNGIWTQNLTLLNRVLYFLFNPTDICQALEGGKVSITTSELLDTAAFTYWKKGIGGRRLQAVVKSLNEEIQVLKDSYDMLGEPWKDDKNKFLQLMILDGCFMLEIIRLATHSLDGYAANDPIFSSHGRLHIAPYIRRDMLLLENQLPMLVLYKLVALESDGAQDEEFVNQLVLNFCYPNAPVSKLDKSLHVLDLYRKSLIQEDPAWKMRIPRVLGGLLNDANDIIRSATAINEAGIQFKKGKTKSLRGISFRGWVLELPVIVVDDATEATFLNLIAFERLHVGAGNEVTSYVFFMDSIIDNERDVALLHSRGIIQNAIGSDMAVAELFKSLSKDIALDPDSSLEVVRMQVNAYCQMPWNEWRANLIHTYFRNPWALLSVIVVFILFALTGANTVYSILPYYNSNYKRLPFSPTGSAAPPPLPTPPPPPPRIPKRWPPRKL